MYNRHKNNAKLDILDQSLFTTAGIAINPTAALKNPRFNSRCMVQKG